MKISKLITIAMTTLSICSCSNSKTTETNIEEQPKQAYLGNDIRYSDDLWDTPQTYSFKEITGEDDYLSNDDIKAVFLKGVNYKNNETRIFGYLGCPKGASNNNKYPGVVLVHGGGGTAYKEWVKLWVDAGYVAFAIDYQGNMPRQDCTIDSNKYDPIPGFVAPNNVGYNDANEKIENQWMYWATSAAIIANSYVRSLNYVDENKVGICGLSWGSIITSITIGYDNRFAFASDIYGCLYNFENNTYMHDIFINNPGALIWDDDKPFINSKIPLHVSYYLQDTNFTLNAISKSVTARENVSLSIFPNWFHAHGGAL